MAATRISEREFKRQVTEARRRGRAEMARELQAKSVRYDRVTHRIVVDLKNGSTFIFPPGLVEGLAGASQEEPGNSVSRRPRRRSGDKSSLPDHYCNHGME